MPGPATNGVGRAQRRAAFLDTIQACRNRDFFLSLDRLIVGERPACGRRARALIERWLDGLEPDEVSYEHLRREPFRWSEDGWVAEFSAIPISPEHRGRPDHRAMGVYADGDVEFIDDAPVIQAALSTKAKKYAGLDRPLIIALGTYIWDRDLWHSTNALYGHAAVTWWENTDGTRGHARIRQPDGFFGVPPSWNNEHVAAVLHVNQLQPHHLHRAEVALWPHPAAPHRWDALSKRSRPRQFGRLIQRLKYRHLFSARRSTSDCPTRGLSGSPSPTSKPMRSSQVRLPGTSTVSVTE